jgi:hypothetical protein
LLTQQPAPYMVRHPVWVSVLTSTHSCGSFLRAWRFNSVFWAQPFSIYRNDNNGYRYCQMVQRCKRFRIHHA